MTTIRGMHAEDCAVWADMRFRLWDSLSVQDHRLEIEAMLHSQTHRGHLALMSGVPVGFAEHSIRPYANGCTSQPVPFLEGIWVEQNYRRRGVGRALINSITAELLESGFTEICSDAGIRNWRSHRAHKQWGFSETERVVYFRRSLTEGTE